MKILYYASCLMFLLCLGNAYGQSANTGTVTGKLIDAVNGEQIDFAGIAIIAPETESIVKNTTSNNGGEFKMGNVPFGKYNIRISYVGYEKMLITDIEINASQPDHNLGVIRLKRTGNEMNEVKIVEKKPVVKYTPDQIDYDVTASVQSEGATATDVLKNVPMVNVDIDGNATIAGKRNSRVFLDGKPSDYMTSNITDLLNILPSDAIEKIEVMTNPPVKYAAEGDGIINIVLKKGYKVGLNGTLSANTGTLGNYNMNSYISYHGKKVTINGSYAYGGGHSTGVSSSLSQNFFLDTTFYHNSYANREGSNNGQNLRGSINYDIDTTQNIRFTTNFNLNHSQGDSYSDTYYLDSNYVTSNLNTQANDTRNRSFNYVFDLNYTWKINKRGEQLDASVTYSGNTASAYRFSDVNYLDGSNQPVLGRLPINQINQTAANNTGLLAKIDYDKPLDSLHYTFNTGLSANVHNNNNNQDVQNFDQATQQYLQNLGLTNLFRYTQDIYSGYASFSIKTDNKWSFRVGSRAELTDVNFNVSTIAQQYNIKPYLNFFPNISIGKQFKEKYNIGISYSQRIGRPNQGTLNPQVYVSTDGKTISYGNPGLDPSFTQQVDFSFGAYGDNWGIYPRLSLQNTKHIVERISTIDTTGITRNSYYNLGTSSYNSFSVYGNYRPARKMQFTGGTTIGRILYQSSGNTRLNRNGISFQAKAGLSMDIPGHYAFEGNFNYYTNTSAQSSNHGSVTSSFAIRKSFLKNKYRVRIMAVNPLGQSSYTTYLYGDNFNQQNYSTSRNRNFSASISYNFSKVTHPVPGK
ncbi:TonB-dependent receptor domain-containing protein [Mucilaginibacter sp. PPCGB 2223]|uniref:TonB-dependent receptor domain-containing protein n=1 Tax=Mucilaginibacter sp. PPCGB 2223 TaxID=1886027 RepID=UPI000A77D8C4|nr:TonB-dependent receptor [Mucilaginibacter sp. PPCGB 2223]